MPCGLPRRAQRTLLADLIGVITIAKLAFEHRIFRQLVDEGTPSPTPLNKTARLLAGELGLAARIREFCAAFSAACVCLL